jgi:hypothetical protein
MSISYKEILGSKCKLQDLDPEIQENIETLHKRINTLRRHYGKPMTVNSGLRFSEDQPKNAATKSNHLIGAAIDIDDDDQGTLWNWVKDNLQLLQKIGLWIEDPRWTHGKVGTWMHFQIVPPKSGKRIFIPSSAPASAPEIWDGKYDGSLDENTAA